MSMNSIDAIAPAYDFTPMSPILKRLVELAVQARRDAAFHGLEPLRTRSEKSDLPQGTPADGARPMLETASAPVETGRLDLRA